MISRTKDLFNRLNKRFAIASKLQKPKNNLALVRYNLHGSQSLLYGSEAENVLSKQAVKIDDTNHLYEIQGVCLDTSWGNLRYLTFSRINRVTLQLGLVCWLFVRTIHVS
jgi:hypothetical protein